AKVGVHLASHGPLDHRLAKGINQILDLHGRHRTFDQAVQQMLRQLRKSGRTGGRLGRNRWLLVFHGHIHDRFLSCYASPTKFWTLSISENLSLREKLRNDFGLVLPELAEEQIDVNGYFAEVQAIIKKQPGFAFKHRV